MAKINKIYPAFFNGVSQQVPELVLDSQCRDMQNCVPDIVQGLSKRPPVLHRVTQDFASFPIAANSTVFHTYDRGEGVEEYIFRETKTPSEPVEVYNKAGQKMVVAYEPSSASVVKSYLSQGALKGLTVQDRTWVFSKKAKVGLNLAATSPLSANYDRVGYYWLKRSSGDKYNPYNYAVYIDGVIYSVDPTRPATDNKNPPMGAENSDKAASMLAVKINASTDFTATVLGSIIKITKNDGGDFTLSSWDSWGSQASSSWKGSTNKITDLPKDMPFSDAYVEIVGDDANKFSNYYVKWNGSSWEECLDPKADRGQLTSMPVKMDRTGITAGVATFTFDVVDWSIARVGNLDNNPNPSFAPEDSSSAGRTIQDMFFYKNRLGIASEDSVTLSESANYTNFFATTVLDVVDTDVIDVTVATNKASRIYYAKPFNNTLYIFTKYAQYELVGVGGFTPSTVSLNNTTNYPMATNVEPAVVNDSLYFISTTDNRQQLREYIQSDNLNVKGVDLNVSTPTYLKENISTLVVDGALGYIMCCTDNNTVYLYNYKEDGTDRVQSAWSKWTLLNGLTTTPGSWEYRSIGSAVIVLCKTALDYRYHTLQLDYEEEDNNIDTSAASVSSVVEYPYESSVLLPCYYPKITDIRTPMNKILIKKITIEGSGKFDAEVYRRDYKTSYSKSHEGSLRDLDLHIASKVGNVDITIKDSSKDNFKITSIVLEGMYNQTSKEMR